MFRCSNGANAKKVSSESLSHFCVSRTWQSTADYRNAVFISVALLITTRYSLTCGRRSFSIVDTLAASELCKLLKFNVKRIAWKFDILLLVRIVCWSTIQKNTSSICRWNHRWYLAMFIMKFSSRQSTDHCRQKHIHLAVFWY